MDEWLIFIHSEGTIIFKRAENSISCMRRRSFPYLYLTNSDSSLHCTGLLLRFRIILSSHSVKPFLRWKTWLGCFSFELRWLTASAAIRNGDVGSLEVDALIHPYPPEWAYGARRSSLRAFGLITQQVLSSQPSYWLDLFTSSPNKYPEQSCLCFIDCYRNCCSHKGTS